MKSMSANQLRQMYLDFFAEKGHEILPAPHLCLPRIRRSSSRPREWYRLSRIFSVWRRPVPEDDDVPAVPAHGRHSKCRQDRAPHLF